MANWWDWITPWDTEAEQAAKAAQAEADAAQAERMQRIAAQSLQNQNMGPQPNPFDPVEQWAQSFDVTPSLAGTTAPVDPWAQVLEDLAPQQQPVDTIDPWANAASDSLAALNASSQPLTGQAYIDQFLAENNQQIPSSSSLGLNGYISPDGPIRPQGPATQQPGMGPDGLWTGMIDPWLVNDYTDSAANERAQFQIGERNAAYDEKYGAGGEGFTQRTWGDVWDATKAAGSALANNINAIGMPLLGLQSGALDIKDLPEIASDALWNDAQYAPLLNLPMEAAKALPGAAVVAPYTEGIGNKAMNVVDTLQATGDYVLGQEPADILPDGMATEDVTVGGYVAAGRDSLWGTFKQIWDDTRDGNILNNSAQVAGVNAWSESVKSFAQAVQPTLSQMARMSPDEIEKAKERAALNWADYESVEKTFDALVDQSGTVAQLTTQAAATYEQAALETDPDKREQLWVQAADLGRQAYALENTHPVELVNANTNLGLQLVTELLLPDVTDLLGGVISVLGASPKARRLASVADEVATADLRALDELAEFAVGPQARAVAGSSYNPRALWRADSWLTTGEARANIAVDQAHRYLSQLVGDVDTASDMKIILRQLSQDPRKLITGMDVKMFQSEALLQRAGSDGLVRFGSMNLANAKESLRIVGNMIEEFVDNAASLNGGPLLNKYDFISEFHDGMLQAGRKFYNVATDSGDPQRSWLQFVASKQRQIVSPFYIYLSPGTWATNIIGGAATAVGDGVFAGGRLDKMDGHLSKLYGVDATMRGFEGVESAQSFAQAASGTGGIMGPIKKAYGSIDENMGKRVYYKSVTHALQKVGQPILQTALAPVLRASGITDAREIQRVTNHLFEVGYSGGNLVEEFTKLLSGRSRVFSLSDVNKQWLDALDADSLEGLYEIVRTAPDRDTALARLAEWSDNASTHWERLINESPIVPQRHVWQAQETAQDMADIAQVGKLAERYGVSPQAVAEFKQTVGNGLKQTQENFKRLAGVISEIQDPANRYLVYDIWGRVNDITTDVRARLGAMAEQAYHVPLNQRDEAWANYFAEANRLWTERNNTVNDLLTQAGEAVARGDSALPNVSQWDILERTARKKEQALWDTLQLEPQSGAYDTQLQRVIQAGQAITDKAVARVYAAARRFNTNDAIDYIISAERNTQIAGAQVRAYLDDVLDSVFKGDTKWEDYFSIRNESWRQLRQHERDVWGIAERQIVSDGLAQEIRTGLRFDAGPDGMVEIVRKETTRQQIKTKVNQRRPVKTQETTQWVVRREDGTITTVPDNFIPEELRARYEKLGDEIDANVELELDNVASAVPFADDITTAQAGTVDGYRIPQSLDEYWEMVVKGEEPPDRLLPQSILDELDAAPAPRSSALDEKVIVQAEEEAAAATEARAAIRTEWDTQVKAMTGLPGIDQTIAAYTRNGIVNVPENRFEDLYGATVAGRRIENQDDVNRLLQEYYDLNQRTKGAKGAVKETQDAIRTTKEAAERIANELNLGARAAVEDMKKAARRTTANATQAGGTQAPELALAAQYATEQIRNIYRYVTQNIDTILQPVGAIGEGQALRAADEFRRQVLPAWDNAKYVAAEYGNRMRSLSLVDFANNTRLDEIAGVLMPYSFWMTRSAKNSLERAIFEPHIWSRMMKTDREIKEMQTQSGDPDRYGGAVPVDLGNGTTYWLKLSPTKYWPTFGLFTQNDYADPESANNAFTYAMESFKSGNASFFPWLEFASKVTSNAIDGNDMLEDVYPMSYIPQGRIIGWMAAKLAGPDIPWALRPGYYEYNIGRELTTMVSEGLITPEQAQWGQDMLRQMRTGEEPLPEQAALQDDLYSILQQATVRAANKELMAAGTSYTTGVQVKPYNQNERQAMEAQAAYGERGYDVATNPYGSEAAMSATYDQYPELGPKFSQGAIYQTEKKRPGIRAVEGEMWDRVNAAQEGLYTAGDTAVDAYITANPGAKKKDIDAARSAAIIDGAVSIIGQDAVDEWLRDNPDAYYVDVVKFVTETIKSEYPSAGTGPDKIDITTVADDEVEQAAIGLMGQQQFDKFMRANPDATTQQIRDWVYSERGPDANKNPIEIVEGATDETLRAASELFPYPEYPGDGASRAAINAYYDERDKIDQQRAAWVENRLAIIESESGVDPRLLANSTGQRDTAYQDYKDRFKTDLELQRLGEIDKENAAKGAEIAARRGWVQSEFGDDAAGVWDEYYNLPKGEARSKFRQEHPEMRVYNTFAYNQDAYGQAVELFGKDALLSWGRVPEWADTPEAKQARAEYYDAHPEAFAVNAWVKGRPTSNDESDTSDTITYNFGKDYQTAKEMFGDNIWDIVTGYKRGWPKAAKSAYFDKYPQLSEFNKWWYGLLDQKGETAGQGVRAGTGGGGGGYRSYGGGGGGEVRQPLRVNIPLPYNRGLSDGLARSPQPQAWRPAQVDTRWMQLAKSLAPKEPREGKINWIRKV